VTGLYLEPRTAEEAVAALAEHGSDATPVAGGTDLVVLARKRQAPLPPVLVALHLIGGLDVIEDQPNDRDLIAHGGLRSTSGLRIGATTPHATIERHSGIIERFTALADGSALVGSPATRHVGTIGGNLANGSPANDTGSALLVLGAQVEVTDAGGGITSMGLETFFEGPGKTALRPGHLVTAITLNEVPDGGRRRGSAYIRLDYRQAMEIAVVGAAAMVTLADDSAGGAIEHAALALTAVAPTCMLVPGIAGALRGRDPDDPAAWDEAGRRAAEAAAPIGDVRAPAGYRAAMIPVIVRRAFRAAVRRARGERIPVPATLWADRP
jgi:CO/xanthine dehydrogenase FAD-binding subunit